MTMLAERLGYAADAKLLIVSCDDLGLTHAGNVASYDALRHGMATSASLMVPCPWARDAAGGYRGEDVGVLLKTALAILTRETVFAITPVRRANALKHWSQEIWQHSNNLGSHMLPEHRINNRCCPSCQLFEIRLWPRVTLQTNFTT